MDDLGVPKSSEKIPPILIFQDHEHHLSMGKCVRQAPFFIFVSLPIVLSPINHGQPFTLNQLSYQKWGASGHAMGEITGYSALCAAPQCSPPPQVLLHLGNHGLKKRRRNPL